MAKNDVGTASVRAPEPITSEHDLSSFDCGEPSLNDWLRRHAIRNQEAGGSRSYVVCEDPGKRVVGYYCLAAGAVARSSATGRVRRNMPEPIPVMVLGRLAVDRTYHGQGLGRSLLKDAILRTLQAAEIVGIRAILVHAISQDARRFYEHCGFHASPIDPMMKMLSLTEVEREFSQG
jgi:GNAT superfamily N-acetyltransferase